jgi:hypothetical protein
MLPNRWEEVGKWLMSFDARAVHVGTMMMFQYVFVVPSWMARAFLLQYETNAHS